MPDFELENAIDGLVCGLDEVGRGPLAGPVVAACVYIPDCVREFGFIDKIQDSKKLSKSNLLSLYGLITQYCTYGIGQCSPAEIDEMNILQASLEAMRRAYFEMEAVILKRHSSEGWNLESQKRLDPSVRWDDGHGDASCVAGERWHALVDGNKLPKLPCSAQAVVKGDNKSESIAAAAIVAKVTRDKIMAELAAEYPHYGWERNAAYPTAEHRAALMAHGVTPHHRRSFKPVFVLLS